MTIDTISVAVMIMYIALTIVFAIVVNFVILWNYERAHEEVRLELVKRHIVPTYKEVETEVARKYPLLYNIEKYRVLCLIGAVVVMSIGWYGFLKLTF